MAQSTQSQTEEPRELPSHARVVIIGGGAVGCSALYHLAKRGWSDLLLLERGELTSGSTWHAAGNCPNFSGSWSIMKLQRYSTALYARLAEEVDYPINYHVTGAVRLAQSRERMEEFEHIAEMARLQGIEFAMLTPAEIAERHPFVVLDGILGGQWDPLDGDIDPAQLTQAFARGARALGARIRRFCKVVGLTRRPDGDWLVRTDRGEVAAEYVVNAAGYRAAEIGAMVGRDIPCVAMSHQYLVTEAIPALAARTRKLPLLRDPDDSYYMRQEGQGLILGPYEREPRARWLEGMPEDFAFQLYEDDLERLTPHIEAAMGRVPILASAGIKRVINGPIPYTPDGNPLVGPAPGLERFFECCVFSFGIVQAGGAGKALADWIVEGETEWDLWSLDPRRYTDYVTREYSIAKAVELYRHEYAIGFPYEERPAGRPAKRSPLYGTLAAKGAAFGARNGWERAAWFRRKEDLGRSYPLTFHRPGFQAALGEECRAAFERVGVVDLPGFAKFEVRGAAARHYLDRLVAGAVPRPGRVSLAYCCTPRGGVLSEFTITCLAEDRFWLIGASTAEWHDRDWLARNLPKEGGVTLANLTARFGTLLVMGPEARKVMAATSDADFSNAAFPWLAAREIEIGGSRCLALRICYAGELGWELHVPMAALPEAYAAIVRAGAPAGLRDIGIYALDSLRLEKCYPAWKQDLEIGYSPLAAGLERFVRLDKPHFIGREALLREQQAGCRQRLVPLLVDVAEADAPYCSPVYAGKERVGLVTSAGFGFRLGRAIALAYVDAALAREGEALEIAILGKRVPARVGRAPLYDPENRRLRA